MISTVLFLYSLAIIFAIILAILWLVLPFVVFRIKDLLAQLLIEARYTNQQLQDAPHQGGK